MLRIIFYRFDDKLSKACVICGAQFSVYKVEAILWEGDKKIGNVCEECIKRGSQGIPGALQIHAEELRKKAEELEQLSSEEIFCPTWEEYQKELLYMESNTTVEQEVKGDRKKMIMSRVLLMGEGVIPYEDLEGLTSRQINIFLSEPDPEKWPSEISHLKKYADMEIDINTFFSRDEPSS